MTPPPPPIEPQAAGSEDVFLLHEFFARAARRWAQHTAVELLPGAGHPDRRRLTYAGLERQAQVIARAHSCGRHQRLESVQHSIMAEDRVLKIDPIRICSRATLGEASVPLYGADIGAGTYVAPHSMVMKQERLLPGYRSKDRPRGRFQCPAIGNAYPIKRQLDDSTFMDNIFIE